MFSYFSPFFSLSAPFLIYKYIIPYYIYIVNIF
nr:MAG TPA: hypothetical protein [Caudoviricetes sp.]